MQKKYLGTTLIFGDICTFIESNLKNSAKAWLRPYVIVTFVDDDIDRMLNAGKLLIAA